MGCILLIDDDCQILTSLSQALKHVGYEVEVACDWDEGIGTVRLLIGNR